MFINWVGDQTKDKSLIPRRILTYLHLLTYITAYLSTSRLCPLLSVVF